MLHSYSVIVPVLNKHREIVRTLQSIADSMAYFDNKHCHSQHIDAEVVVVDEGSNDGTKELVQNFAGHHRRFRLLQHHRSLGIGPARNTGVRFAQGEVLYYCDGDDLFLPEHIFVCFSLLEHGASANAEDRCLDLGRRGQVVLPANQTIAGVRTGVQVDDDIHPYWQAAIESTIMQNLCIRRECHEFGEGFPEEVVYKYIRGCEDVAYNQWLKLFFRIGRVGIETVKYIRYPGNSFDRQIEKFQQPPGVIARDFSPQEQEWHKIRSRLEEDKVGYLLEKWRVLGAPAVPPSLLNWSCILRELMQRKKVREAAAFLDQAQGQSVPADLSDWIREAAVESHTL